MAYQYIGVGEVVHITVSGAAVSKGDVLPLADSIAVYQDDGAIGDQVAAGLVGVHELPAKSTDTWSIGDVLYWDADPGELTTTVTSNTRAGRAYAAKTSGQTTGQVLL
jgi:predicted RecA/RadA family phage recombinase